MNRTYRAAIVGWSIGLVAALALAVGLGTGFLASVLLGFLFTLCGVVVGVLWADR